MGIWGPKLYEDDIANDIKIEYEGLLKDGKSNEEALNNIYITYKDEMEDPYEKSVFWMVLADILYQKGNLTTFVKEKALEVIALEENLKIWKIEASKEDYEERKKEIEKLKRKLIEYKNNGEKDTLKTKVALEKKQNYKNDEWMIGDTYAYKIQNLKYKDKYLIIRKIKNCEYQSSIRYQSAIVYIQITSNNELPKNEKEINKLEYIIISNEGNVKHQYRMILTSIPKKESMQLLYLGNFSNINPPKDEYIETIDLNIWEHSFKDIEFLLNSMEELGTSKDPVYYDINPKNISDSHIRFLMRVKYYKEALDIKPSKGAIVKNDPLLFISFIDSLMIGGFVKNPVGIITEDVKQETYKKINELKNIINFSDRTKKEKKIKILNDFEEKIKNYKIIEEN